MDPRFFPIDFMSIQLSLSFHPSFLTDALKRREIYIWLISLEFSHQTFQPSCLIYKVSFYLDYPSKKNVEVQNSALLCFFFAISKLFSLSLSWDPLPVFMMIWSPICLLHIEGKANNNQYCSNAYSVNRDMPFFFLYMSRRFNQDNRKRFKLVLRLFQVWW